jgi:uncharacterized membrane protein YcgQ (UPF0703/DUF1980 family)
MLIAFLTALTIVLGMRMMGAMLISSLIIFPALTSMRVFKTFRSVTICSALVSLACFFIGVVISYIYAMPTGASVVMVNIFAFLLFWVLNLLSKEKKPMKHTLLTKPAALSLLCLLLVTGCGVKKAGVKKNTAGTLSVSLPAATAQKAATKNAADTGETMIEIKEKMFIAQTNEIYLNPEDYLGKTIKLQGLFKSEQYPGAAAPYCFVLRYGPGCCGNDGNAGFEVAWDQRYTLKTPYPTPDDWVEATGVLSTYEEDGFPYFYLALASLTVLDERGAEYVSQ